jgi:hypothetical protein
LFKAYRISRCKGDRWAGGFPIDRCKAHGITLEPSEKTKSELYQDFLAIVNSQRCELLDHARLKSQLLGLERSVRSGGKDQIDHARGQHDDIVNAAVGAMLSAQQNQHPVFTQDDVRLVRERGAMRAMGMGLFPQQSPEQKYGELTWARMRARGGQVDY